MQLNLNEQERQNLLVAINMAIKGHQDSIEASAALLPLAMRIKELKEEASGNADR